MTSPDEQVLRQRLHHELAALPAPAAPVGAAIRRGTMLRGRRWVAAASGLAAVAAVAVSVPLLSGRAQPARGWPATPRSAGPGRPPRASTGPRRC